MIVGATGSGKSTLINGMANYILGVKWNDQFRFKLITDETHQSQAHSQTQEVTAYTIHKMEGSRIPYALTVIDTPGFGDTQGVQRDKEIISQIEEFLSNWGIDHLDGIGIVTQGSLARLTPTQRYVFDSILSMFGRDLASNIFVMTTFADGEKPPVIHALKAAEIPFAKAYMFNNSAVFARNTNSEDDEDDEGDVKFDEMFWKMGTHSFRDMFSNLARAQHKSLMLTKEVLEGRQKLEVYLQNPHTINPGYIRKILSRLDEIALKADPLTDVEHIQFLIESEKQWGIYGWDHRIKYLKQAEQQARLLRRLATGNWSFYLLLQLSM